MGNLEDNDGILVRTTEKVSEMLSRIASLESQLAAERAKWADVRALCIRDGGSADGLTSVQQGRVFALNEVIDHIDREPTADVVRLTVGPGGILLTPAESVMTHGTDTAFEYVMRVEDGEYHLVRLKGVE